MVNKKWVLLQQDITSPHTARLTQEKIQQVDATEFLPHPAYSLDLALSDFHLVQYELFASKDKAWHHCRIVELTERWIQTIESSGPYFEE